jgi:hypothetical protein
LDRLQHRFRLAFPNYSAVNFFDFHVSPIG